MKSVMRRGQDFAGRMTPLQKIALGAVTVTVIAGGFVLTRAGTGVAMAPLYTGLEASDAAAVVDKLNAQGEAYELTDAGHTVLVPKADVYNMRVAMAGAGLPSSNSGYSILDNQGITTSESRQRIDYQRALEGELQMTLRVMDGVQSASVHLALPDESVFADVVANPTASVMIVPKGAGAIGDDQVQAIVHLVASSVKNMKPEDVTVIDSNGTVLSAPGMSGGGSSGATARSKAERAYGLTKAAELAAQIAKITGPDKVSVTVTVDLDLDQKASTTDDYGPVGTDTAGAVVVGDNTSAEVYGPGVNAGAPGVVNGGTVVTTPVPSTVPAGGYQKGDSQKTYAVDRTVSSLTQVPGQIKKLNVAVLLDDKTVTVAQAAEIQTLVTTAAGIDSARGDILTITRLPFDVSAEAAAATQTAADTALAAKARMMELIRTLAVVFVIIIALILAYRSTRKARKITAVPFSAGEIASAQGTQVLTPELASVPSGALVMAGPSAPNSLAMALDRVDSPMAEISEIAETRPEEVANVLRAWLAESKGRR
jgi:flagellar M-ring protein FliF